MATTLSYAKIVRNQKDDEKSAHMDKIDTSLENSNTTQINNKTDLSKEASNRKKAPPMKDTNTWPTLTGMGNNITNNVKLRPTSYKEQMSASSLQESKKDSSANSSETSSVSDEVDVCQETNQDELHDTSNNVEPSVTSNSSIEVSINESKETGSLDTNEDPGSTTNITAKKKKPKSKRWVPVNIPITTVKRDSLGKRGRNSGLGNLGIDRGERCNPGEGNGKGSRKPGRGRLNVQLQQSSLHSGADPKSSKLQLSSGESSKMNADSKNWRNDAKDPWRARNIEGNNLSHASGREKQQNQGSITQLANGGRGAHRGRNIGRNNYQHQGGRSRGGRGGHHQHLSIRGIPSVNMRHIQSTRGRHSYGSLPTHDELFIFHLDGAPPYCEVVAEPTFIKPVLEPTYYFDNSYVPQTLPEEVMRSYVKAQIEYYFSPENLQKDFFLRRKMDSEGYLPVSLIASFNRVQALTGGNDIAFIVQAVRDSDVVQVNADGVNFRAKYNPTKWPIAIDEPDPVSPSPTPTANSGHSGSDANNIEAAFIESDMYNNNELAEISTNNPYLCDISNSLQHEANYPDAGSCFILPSPTEAIDAYNSSSYTNHIESSIQSAPDLILPSTLGIPEHPVDMYSVVVPLTDTLICNASAGNLNPGVPEFVPTFVASNCADSLNNENPQEDAQDNSDREGTDGDNESEEADIEYNGKKVCKKAFKHSAQMKYTSSQQHHTSKNADLQKTSTNGKRLKQSLTQLLNTGSSETADNDGVSRLMSNNSVSKIASIAPDEEWVEQQQNQKRSNSEQTSSSTSQLVGNVNSTLSPVICRSNNNKKFNG